MIEKKRQKNISHKLIAMALAAIICVGVGGTTASAATVNSDRETPYNISRIANTNEYPDYTEEGISLSRDYRSLAAVNNKSIYAYTRKSVYINGRSLSKHALLINGICYIPFRQAANAIGASYSYNSSAKTSTMTSRGLTLTAGAGCYTVYANDRPLFATSPVVIMSDGAMYIPADSFAKAVGMKVDNSYSVSINGSYSPLKSAASYYREDELLWLARIIHAESQGEPLLGKIAVGNVVLNRVRSKDYPNTIYGVIFDRKYGVQFSPILDGSIYNAPTSSAVVAAKICLEGFNVNQGALFFLYPRASTSSWIPNNRTYLFSIGKHDFYA